MGQLLRLAILLFGLWLILRIVRRALGRNKPGRPTLTPPADMLRCDYCGVFVPGNEIITTDDQHHYCSRQHAEAARRQA
jgi:hypothetical protein